MKTLLATIENKVSIPVLSTVYFDNGIYLATDMDIQTRYKTDQERETGLYNVKPLKEGIYNKSDIDIKDFPVMPYLESNAIVKNLKVKDLEFVSIAMSKEETRYYLNGIAFDSENMVATDGHRLHKVSGIESTGLAIGETVKNSFDDGERYCIMSKHIVPRKAIKLFIMACKEQKIDSFNIEFLDTRATAFIGNYVITTKLIDGTFPDYLRVIPKDYCHELEFKAESILDNYKKLKAMTSNKTCAVKLQGNKVTAKSEFGEYECLSGLIMPSYTNDDGESISHSIGFNLNYLKESAFDSTLHYKDSTSPVMLKAGNRLAVLMPLRI